MELFAFADKNFYYVFAHYFAFAVVHRPHRLMIMNSCQMVLVMVMAVTMFPVPAASYETLGLIHSMSTIVIIMTGLIAATRTKKQTKIDIKPS